MTYILATRNIDMHMDLWLDDSPPPPQQHGRKSTLLLALLARVC